MPSTPSSHSSAEEDDSFPTLQLAILAVCRLSEPIAFTSIVAYNYVFVQDLRPGDDQNAAFYAGLLISAFALAEAVAAMPWGTVSDKYGRKPVVLFGLAGVALSNLIFGFATNYWVAFGARVIGGALNGNVAVMQTMVAEMCKKPEHEPRAYTMIPFMWSAGSIFGAAMGGYLARPADTWPSAFPSGNIFNRFPYLLPNFVAAVFIVFTILLGIAFLKETNIHARSPLFAQLNLPDERTPLLGAGTQTNKPGNHQKPRDHRASFTAMPPLTTGTTVDIRRLSVSTAAESFKATVFDDERDETAVQDDVEEAETPPKHGYSRAMILLIVQLFLMSYHQMGFSSLTPVFLLDDPYSEDLAAGHPLDLRGGLGYTIRDVGMFMAGNGFAALIIQLLIVPPFIERVGVWKSFVWLTVLCPLVYVIAPFLTTIPRPQLPTGVYVVVILQAFTLLIIYPCLLIALKNATPSMSMLGQVNGLAMAMCSGARTIAPPAAGAVYGKAGSAAGMWSVGAVAVVAAVMLLFMKPPPRTETAETTLQEGETGG